MKQGPVIAVIVLCWLAVCAYFLHRHNQGFSTTLITGKD